MFFIHDSPGQAGFTTFRYTLGILTPNTDWILFTLVALYTHPPRSISAIIDTSILHFCASSFCVSFFSHRELRTPSDVAFAIYFVFFASSSSLFDAEVVAATTADAEFMEAAMEAAVRVCVAATASLYDDGFDLLIVTGVQSWQSGACESVVLYLFFGLDDIITVVTVAVVIMYTRDRFISVYTSEHLPGSPSRCLYTTSILP